jgi:hypothetical protein
VVFRELSRVSERTGLAPRCHPPMIHPPDPGPCTNIPLPHDLTFGWILSRTISRGNWVKGHFHRRHTLPLPSSSPECADRPNRPMAGTGFRTRETVPERHRNNGTRIIGSLFALSFASQKSPDLSDLRNPIGRKELRPSVPPLYPVGS